MFLQGLEPKAVMEQFEAISAIPRGSGNEEAVARYVEEYAKARGLFVVRDDRNNVLVRKPASAGAEGKPGVLLQGHLDIVCEKNEDTDFDFLTQGIIFERDGDLLRAKGTTLGADNGTAVAFMLAALDDTALVHPTLECLFTTNEETGMDGAKSFDGSLVTAKAMINMDCGPEGSATVSCAGGMRVEISKRFAPQAVSGTVLRVSVKGLMGGHSGTCINRGRANANVLMGRVLASLPAFHLVSLAGGSKENAIPRECFAVLTTQDEAALRAQVEKMQAILKAELAQCDEEFTLTVEPASADSQMSQEDTQALVAILVLAPNGVLAMSATMEGLVECSSNMGVITTQDGEVVITFAPRSSVESKQDETQARLTLLGESFGATVRAYNRYPGWRYDPNSKLRDLYVEVYRDLTGKEAEVRAVHAGLECGILLSKVPGLDVVAIGCEAHGAHTPQEEVSLSSMKRTYELLVELLRRLA